MDRSISYNLPQFVTSHDTFISQLDVMKCKEHRKSSNRILDFKKGLLYFRDEM
jgi:hypothetical protein